MRVLLPIVVRGVGNVFPESTILCVTLSNRDDPLHTYVQVCVYLKAL